MAVLQKQKRNQFWLAVFDILVSTLVCFLYDECTMYKYCHKVANRAVWDMHLLYYVVCLQSWKSSYTPVASGWSKWAWSAHQLWWQLQFPCHLPCHSFSWLLSSIPCHPSLWELSLGAGFFGGGPSTPNLILRYNKGEDDRVSSSASLNDSTFLNNSWYSNRCLNGKCEGFTSREVVRHCNVIAWRKRHAADTVSGHDGRHWR